MNREDNDHDHATIGPGQGASRHTREKIAPGPRPRHGCGRGFKPGLYLYGSGGVGKSFTILRHLERLEAPHQLFNSRMTAKGLFLALGRAPDLTHVLEDMERLTKDPDAQGVLRSALWSQPGHDRLVTWTTATGGRESFVFRGGLILISNRPLADLPELRALATESRSTGWRSPTPN